VATNYLKDLMAGGFQGSAGYKFALDQGQEAIRRRMPRGSGNVLAALNANAVGTAQQDYGNEFQRRLQADTFSQQGDQFDRRLGLDRELGQGQLSLGRDRLGLDRELGQGQLGLGRDRLGLDQEMGRGRLGLDAVRASNDFTLGSQGLDDAREGRFWDYDLGRRRADLDSAGQENNYNLSRDTSARNWYDSRTQRGSARSADWGRRQQYR
jgi:hypothetical protein